VLGGPSNDVVIENLAAHGTAPRRVPAGAGLRDLVWSFLGGSPDRGTCTPTALVDREMRRLLVVAVVLGLLAGCGGSSRIVSPGASRGRIPTAACAVPRSLARAPLPQETGVYRTGPLLLVTGEDLAQIPHRQLRRPSGSKAMAVLIGDQPVVPSVDPGSRTRFALQFTPPTADPAATGIDFLHPGFG
jgi:hypothetical protein